MGFPSQVNEATLVSVEHGITYGDWVAEYINTLIHAMPLASPLLVPVRLRSRPFVERDLVALGIDFRFIDRPTFVRQATVLHKRRYLGRWTKEDVAAYRAAFGITTEPPRRGSLLYLSREGVPHLQHHPTRVYPNAEVGALVASLGGRTLKTQQLGLKDFVNARTEAETVVADHGSAMVNLQLWETKNVIELVTDGWWDPSMMSVAKSSGVRNYAIVRVSGSGSACIAAIRNWIKSFQTSVDSLWAD